MNNMIYMNFVEFIFFLLSLGLVFLVALKNLNSIIKSLAVTILVIPILYLSIEGTTQFLTTDEAYIFTEVINIHNSGMEQWYMSANRTSDAVIGTFLSLFQKYTHYGRIMDSNELIMFSKAVRWFVGFLIIIAIYGLLNKYYIAENQRVSYFIIYFYSVLSLPVSLIALKIANYDLLSMLLGTLAIILLLRALQIKSDRHALVGIIISLLATQEKLIAYPILAFSLIIFTYLKLEQTENRNYKTSFYYSFYAIFIAFLTSLTTFLIVAMAARNGHIPHISFYDVIVPIVGASASIIRRLIVGGDFSETILPPSFLLILLTGFIISYVSLVLIKIKPWLINLFFPWLKGNMRLISIITIFMVFLVGVVGTYSIETVFASLFLPAQEGQYVPPYSFNNNAFYYDATSKFEYFIYSIAHAYAIFTNSIPSIYLVILLLVWNQRHKRECFSGWGIILLLVLVMPLVYALTYTPMQPRYFNLFLFTLILIIGIEMSKIMSYYKNIIQLVLVSVFVVSLLIEILPFRPIFGAFRPIWSHSFNALPSKGTIQPIYWGWGDSLFLAGKKIEKMMAEGQIKNDKVRLYFPYFGTWINSNKAITIYNFYTIGDWEAKHFDTSFVKLMHFTKSDYLLVNNGIIVRGLIPFFKDIKPIFTISYRGYTQAWVYRGDQIKHKFKKLR